jgi:SAM-dependent methyltransferase
VKPDRDAYGREIFAAFQGEGFFEIIERDDGCVEGRAESSYFSEFEDWPDYEKKAIALARGRVLDIGSGAGRVSLHLQSRNHEVLALDNSPLALKVCRLRGVRNTRLMSITRLGSGARVGVFDTVLMFGNNFGLFGSFRRARWLLRRFHSITSPDALILAETRNPYETPRSEHRAYHRLNRRRGRMGGQIRIRVLFRRHRSPWFDYLFVSKEELRHILEGTGWRLRETIDSTGSAYVAVITKDQ